MHLAESKTCGQSIRLVLEGQRPDQYVAAARLDRWLWIGIDMGRHMQNRRLTFFECGNDLASMMDVGKAADLILLMIDGRSVSRQTQVNHRPD
jgi:hypothetical protein